MVDYFGDLPFKLRVERAFVLTGRHGTVIAGRFLQGTIHNGDHLELVTNDDSGGVQRTTLTCERYALLCEVDWDRSKPALLGVTVSGIGPDRVVPGSFLQAAESPAFPAAIRERS
jgi:translation elongation factor EF-Tu-like GTPase